MRFRFIWIGKTKDKHWKALQEDYLERLSHFVKYDIVELKDAAKHETKEDEGKRILALLNQSSFTVLLDVEGECLSSHALSKIVDKWQIQGKKEVTFIIGGPVGVSSEVAESASFRLSLSFLTFTHDMARVVLVEQLYRAYSILNGFPYQK
jgi:23S rRNA (pseudouridine1915-N3)-methyltransferase